MTVLLCVGETEAEKDSGEADAVLERQLSIGLADIGAAETEKIWIAYEPVWAIGVQGKPITFAYADERLYKIRQALKALLARPANRFRFSTAARSTREMHLSLRPAGRSTDFLSEEAHGMPKHSTCSSAKF